MRPDRTMLFSDLDGTLFGSDGRVSPENRAALEAYMAAGGLFAVATGRDPKNARHFLGDLPMNAPAIVVNGCGLYDFAEERYTDTWTMDRERVRPFLHALLADFPDLELQVYTEEGIRYCTPRETANPQLMAMHNPCEFTTLEALPDSLHFLKAFMYAPLSRETPLLARLREGEAAGLFRHVPGTTDVGGPITYHEILPDGASKGVCVDRLRTLPAFQGKVILAAGDFWNDYELLERADIAIAPENAIPEIKALCQYIGVSHNEHLMRDILENFLPAL